MKLAPALLFVVGAAAVAFAAARFVDLRVGIFLFVSLIGVLALLDRRRR